MTDSDFDPENDAPEPGENKEDAETILSETTEMLGDTYTDITTQSAEDSETVSEESSKSLIVQRKKKRPGAKVKFKRIKKPQKQEKPDETLDLKLRLPPFHGWDIGGTIQPAKLNHAMEEKELTPILLERAQRLGWGRRGYPDVDLFASSVCQPMLQRTPEPPPPPPPLPPIASAEVHDKCGERKRVAHLYRLLGNEKPQILQEDVRPASDNPANYLLDKSGHQALMEMTTILVDQRPDDPLQVLQERLDHEARLEVRRREALATIKSVAQRKWDEKKRNELAELGLLSVDEDPSPIEELTVDEEVETHEAVSDIDDIDENIMWGHDTDCDPIF